MVWPHVLFLFAYRETEDDDSQCFISGLHNTLCCLSRYWESDEYRAFVQEHGPLQEEKPKLATHVPLTTTEPQSSQATMTTATPTVTATSTSSHSGSGTGPNTKYGVLPPISADGGGSNPK